MQDILNNNIIILSVSVVALVLSTFCLLSALKTKKRLKVFFNGSRAQDLEGLLAGELKKVRELELLIKSIGSECKETKKVTLKSIHKIGILRFNPFKDMGGNQSFTVALLDAKNNGIILSSIYTRVGARTYAKSITNGTSKHTLSEEEKKVLEKAMK